MMKTATVCAAILLAFAIAGVAPARDQQGKLDLIIRGGHVIDPRNGINSLMTGAYLYVGDGHALQGDGEGLGSGVETSMDVEFTVRVHKRKRIALPRLENAEHIVSIANGTNFDRSLRAANSDIISWLVSDYGVTEPEAHLLVGSVVQHRIVLFAGSIAAMIPKKFLARR
jgi:acetamidase/formamidase